MTRTMLAFLLATASLNAAVVRVLQSNAAGDNIHVIDPATNLVVGTIEDIEVPHGVAIAPDGGRIYVTNESLSTLDVVDARTLKVFKRIPLSGRVRNTGRQICGCRIDSDEHDQRHRHRRQYCCVDADSQRGYPADGVYHQRGRIY